MKKLGEIIIKRRKAVIVFFLVLTALSAVASPMVGVNYDLVDYLPNDAQSTNAIDIMIGEFGGQMPNANVMISDVTISEALAYSERLLEIEGVLEVTWLDDVIEKDTLLTVPVEFLDQDVRSNYYKNGAALFSVEIARGEERIAVQAIRALIGENNAVAGNAVNVATSQQMSVTEVMKALAILMPVILLILILTTSSWLEPLLFLASIGVAVLVNMGSNLFFGHTSFITQTVSPVLQLAVSLDYAIFLLHSFREYRQEYEPEEAMKLAMKKSAPAISSSAATTVIGFLALAFMRFRIGADLGIILVKGVILSFLSVMVLLPALTLACVRLLDRTAHRRLIPEFKGAGKWLMRISIPFLIAAVLIAVPCYLAQSNIQFQYGTGSVTQASRSGQDQARIASQFGEQNMLALLVPRGDTGRETELCEQLEQIPHVKSVVSYVTSVGSAIPPEYLERDILDQFYSERYARIILYTDMAEEGAETFRTVHDIRETASNYYSQVFLAGQSATLYDMEKVVSVDTRTVNLCAIVGIFLVLLITFRSASVPLLLLFTIETAIWINLSFAYFTGQSYNFVGYLVISTVQLGSTVDYAILMTSLYLENRKQLPKKEALKKAFSENLIAVLTSAAILSLAGFALAMTSSNPIISELGTLLGRGALLSLLMVACVLPALLIIFDKLIQKTTLARGLKRSRHGS